MTATAKTDPLPFSDKWNHEKGEAIEKFSNYTSIEEVAKIAKQNPDLVSPSIMQSINEANESIFMKRFALFGGSLAFCGLQYFRSMNVIKHASQSVLIKKFALPIILPIVLHQWLIASDKNKIEAAYINILLRLPRLRYNNSVPEYLS